MSKHLKKVDKQFLYYRLHGFIFKGLIYGSEMYSKELNQELIKNYLIIVKNYM